LSKFLGFYPLDNFSETTSYFQFTDGVFLPYYSETCLNREVSEAIALLMRTGFGELNRLKFNRVQRRILIGHLLDFYRWHLPAISGLQTQAVLEEVFG